MTVNLSALGGAGQQFFDNNGNVLTGGKLWSYQAGTTTPQTTYTSASGATAHTNPIVLDSAGRVATGEIWVTAGQNYKFVLMTSANVTIATWDNITGINGTGIPSNANNVEYDPPFTGALTSGYTVEDKLAQTVSVKDFGAVGDGMTNDAPSIQAAINYCTTNDKSLFIPNGIYLLANTALLLFGGITIQGEDQDKTVLRVAKADLSAPDGISGYTNLFKLTNTIAGAEIYFKTITLDGGDLTINKPFTNYTKKILDGWATGTHETVKVLSLENCTVCNATSEGISSNNYDYVGKKIVALAEYTNCKFISNGGASCNVNGNQRVVNCLFNNEAWIEHANFSGDGSLEVLSCRFKNASKVFRQTISVLNTVFPMTGTPADYASRLGTSFIVRDCVFEDDLDWVTGWGGTNPWIQSIGVKSVGTTVIENNTFINGGYNQTYGGCPVGTYDWLDNVYIRNNTFTVNAAGFTDALIFNTYSSAATANILDVSGNRTSAEYPINNVNNLYGNMQNPKPKRFISTGNYISLPVNQAFTATLLNAFSVVLPVMSTFTVRVIINIVNIAATNITITNASSGVLTTVYNATPLTTGLVYVTATLTTDNLSPNQYLSTYLIKSSGDVANTFDMEFEEI